MGAARLLIMRGQHMILVEECDTLPCGGRFNCENFHGELKNLPQVLCFDRLVML